MILRIITGTYIICAGQYIARRGKPKKYDYERREIL